MKQIRPGPKEMKIQENIRSCNTSERIKVVELSSLKAGEVDRELKKINSKNNSRQINTARDMDQISKFKHQNNNAKENKVIFKKQIG